MHTERNNKSVESVTKKPNQKPRYGCGVMTAGTGGGANVPVSVVELMDTREHVTHEAQGLGGDAFRCDFIRSRLSHSHSDEREREIEAEQTEVEDEEYQQQQPLEK